MAHNQVHQVEVAWVVHQAAVEGSLGCIVLLQVEVGMRWIVDSMVLGQEVRMHLL